MEPKLCKVCGHEMAKLVTHPVAEMYVCTNCMKKSLIKNVMNLSKCPSCGSNNFAKIDISDSYDEFYNNVKEGLPVVSHVCVNCGAIGGFNFPED